MTVKPVRNDIDAARVSFASIIIAARRIFGDRKISPTTQAPNMRPQSDGSPKSKSSPSVAPCCRRSSFEAT